LPGIATGKERQLEHAEIVEVARFAVWLDRAPGARVAGPTGADGEFADPARRVGDSRWRLRRKALVDVLVPVKDDLRPELVQRIPERLQVPVVAYRSRVESRMMPVRERARFRARCEIRPAPSQLRRCS